MRKIAVALGILLIVAGLASVAYSRLPEIHESISFNQSASYYISSDEPQDKLTFNIQQIPEEASYIVELTAPAGIASQQQIGVMAEIQTIGAEITGTYDQTVNAIEVTAGSDEILTVATIPQVRRIYRNELLDTTITGFGDVWPTFKMLMDDEGSIAYTGRGIMVFVIDTGIDASHPALQRNGMSIVKDTYTIFDTPFTHWHGTLCASIIASNDPEIGIGVAPDVDLGNVCVFNSNGQAKLGDLLKGIEYVARWHRMHDQFVIASCSWGIEHDGWKCGGWRDPCIICEAINGLSDVGIPVVVAAGNSGPYETTVNSPGQAYKCLSVGAVDVSNAIASFSSRGPTTDGQRKPDVVAYGVSITGAAPDGRTITASGTSFATPFVTGVLAKLAEKYGTSYTPMQYYDAIRQGAIDLGDPGYDYVYGYGMVNVTNAFSSMNEMTPMETYYSAGVVLTLIGLLVTASPLMVRRKYG